MMRVILGVRRSARFRVVDLHKLTTLDRLSDRREKSLNKFMQDVVEERIHTQLRRYCTKGARVHCTRSQGYTVPRFNTNVGRQRIVIRGLKLLNRQSEISGS
jgi:hypothetical protein